MILDKKDMYIKAKLQQDKKISNQANEVFKKFEGGINLENNNEPKERKVFKLNLKQAVLAFSSLMIVAVLGGNLYAHLNGKPNLYSAIKGLFVKEDKYTASEIEVNQTVESNGIKLTLKTVAMDENILITKYVAEGEKLASEFYTYPEFEEDMIKVIKIRNVIAGNDIGESGYENYTLKDVTTMRKEIVAKLQLSGITEEEAKDVEKMATEAYTEYIGVELGHEGYSSEEAQELITQTIAMFESKVASKYQIMISNDTLQEFSIDAISQKIEKSGNQYIIYNVYNVDTISDLASKFNLSINVTQIGSTEGLWNFRTELEKARLDTRVETIDFYNNNKTTIAIDDERSITVEVKRIVISDFSSVIMIQTNMNELNLTDDLPVPFTYIVRSGDDNSSTKIVGTGNEENLLSGGKATDRIILDEVDFNVKHIWVDIYSKDGKYLDFINMPEIRDEKYAKSLELTQSFASKEAQVSFKYPGDWTTKETMDAEVILVGPEDVDGNNPTITIGKISEEDYENIKDFTLDYGHETLLEKGETTVAGAKGYYGITTFVDIGMYEKSKIIVVENNGQYFYLRLTTNTDVEYSRYEETFNKIIETIEFVEPEKSYRTFSTGKHEIIKLYEDNTLTITFDKESVEAINGESKFDFEANVEYEITGVPKELNSNKIDINVLGIYDDHVDISMIYVIGGTNLYYVDIKTAKETGKFEIVEEPILRELWSSVGYATSEVYDYYRNKGTELGSRILHQVKTKDGKIYILDYNSGSGKFNVEEYIEKPEQTEPDTTSKYENMSYESFEIYNGVVKQYEDNTVTVEWNDAINNHENKLWEVKPNIEYVITGLDGKVKSVHNIIKDRQEKNMPTIKILTEKGTLYGTLDLKNDYNMEASIVGRVTDTETVIQQSAEYLIAITKSGNAFKVQYEMYVPAGKAPTKDIMYDTIEQYLWYDDEFYIIEADREKAIVAVEYNQKENGDISVNVSVKVNDSTDPTENSEKEAFAIVEYNRTNEKWEVTTFNANP